MVAELSAECPTQQLYGAFVSEAEIPIADIGFDLTPWVETGFSVGVVRQAEMAWWFLFDCLKKDSLKTMASLGTSRLAMVFRLSFFKQSRLAMVFRLSSSSQTETTKQSLPDAPHPH